MMVLQLLEELENENATLRERLAELEWAMS